jgi:hypothetical protein
MSVPLKQSLLAAPAALALLVAAMPAVAQAPAASAAPAASDPKAIAVADQVLEALGGKAAWNATRYLRFDFAVESEGRSRPPRRHWWDKQTGRYRVEGQTQEGVPFVVLMNLNTKEGSVHLGGQRVQGEDEKKFLDRGYGAWVNDTYWLLMPYKLKDPGVILAYQGQVSKGDDTWDKLALSFQSVGLTPGDHYWVYVNTRTHLVDRWEYILQSMKPEEPATRWDWKGWKRYASIQLAPDRVSADGKVKISFPVLEVLETMPDAVFTSAGKAGE